VPQQADLRDVSRRTSRPATSHPVRTISGGRIGQRHETEGEITSQHYAFLVGEEDFDRTFARIGAQGLAHWADPGLRRAGEINRNDGGRGVYFKDPDGHLLEIITRPYGSGG